MKFERTSKHYGGNPLYQKIVFIAQNSKTRKRAAESLGISVSTLRRWIAHGLPEKPLVKTAPDLKKIVSRSYRNTKSRVKRALEKSELYEPKPISFYRYFGGVRSKYILVHNASYKQMLHLLMEECLRYHEGFVNYAGYRFRFRLNAPFEGFYSGDGIFTSVEDYKTLPYRERKWIREHSSWISVTMENPYLSSKVFPFLSEGRDCRDPIEYQESLDRFYYMPNVTIEEMIFSEIRGDEETGERIDYYNTPFND